MTSKVFLNKPFLIFTSIFLLLYKPMKSFIFVLVLLAFGFTAQSFEAQSGPEKNQMIELFSSEGCSSCPPAEKWIGSLKNAPGLWKSFIPLEFHVDYWNRLGWLDPFSNNKFSQRQRSYAATWRNGRVYTPGFVLNGKEWKLGTQKIPQRSSEKVGTLKVSQKKKKFYVSFYPNKNIKKKYSANIAVLAHGLETNVKYGENAGRKLKHEFVVLGSQSFTLNKDSSHFLGETFLPKFNKKIAAEYSVVVWITKINSMEPIQITGGPWNQK